MFTALEGGGRRWSYNITPARQGLTLPHTELWLQPQPALEVKYRGRYVQVMRGEWRGAPVNSLHSLSTFGILKIVTHQAGKVSVVLCPLWLLYVRVILSGRAECWCVTLWQLLLTVGPWTLPPQHSTGSYQPHTVFVVCPFTQGLTDSLLHVYTSLVTSLHLSVDVSPVVTGNSRLVFTVFTVISGAHCPSSLCTHCCTHCCTLYTEHWTHSVHNTSLSSTLQLSLTLRIPHRTSHCKTNPANAIFITVGRGNL